MGVLPGYACYNLARDFSFLCEIGHTRREKIVASAFAARRVDGGDPARGPITTSIPLSDNAATAKFKKNATAEQLSKTRVFERDRPDKNNRAAFQNAHYQQLVTGSE
jgi:hypothetical protein